jgi:hypothetical protein
MKIKKILSSLISIEGSSYCVYLILSKLQKICNKQAKDSRKKSRYVDGKHWDEIEKIILNATNDVVKLLNNYNGEK